MFGWEDVLCEGEHPPSFIQLNYDTAKNRAGKVQIYLRFISPFFFLDGDDNLQFFLDFGRKFSRIYRYAEERCKAKGKRPETFTFLGFTHYGSRSRNGKFRVKRRTSRKKFAKKCKEVHRGIAKMRNQPLPEIIKKLNQMPFRNLDN